MYKRNASFHTDIMRSFPPIDIHLDELQAKARQRLQSSGHYERIEKIKRKIHRTLKEERNRHRKAELTSRLRKKVWFKSVNESIEKQKTADPQKNSNRKQNQNSRKKLTNYFVKF